MKFKEENALNGSKRKVLRSGMVLMGLCGKPTGLFDSYGHELFIGDIVDVYSADPAPKGREIEAVGPEFIVESEFEGGPFIMGLAGSMRAETKYYLDGDESSEDAYDYAESYYISGPGYRWLIKKIKGFEDTVRGECWGSGNVTVHIEAEPEEGNKDSTEKEVF